MYPFDFRSIWKYLVLGLHLIYSSSMAQDIDTSRQIIENGWVEIMDNKIAVDISLNNDYSVFQVNTPVNKIILYPNASDNIGFGLNYEFISFSVNVAPKFLPGNDDNDLKGKTTSFELGTALYSRHWFAQGSFSKVKGYYLLNTKDYLQWSDGDPFIQFPDLNYQGIVLQAGYSHNPKFSFQSLTTQTERQLKSTGSFVPILNFHYYIVDDKSSEINTQKSNNIEINMGPGYAYTFVFKEKYYVSLAALTSFGYLNSNFTTRLQSRNVETSQDNFLFRSEGRLGIGHNGKRFYSGLYTDINGTWYKQENTNVHNAETRILYHLFIGMRFNAPKIIRKPVKKINDKIDQIF